MKGCRVTTVRQLAELVNGEVVGDASQAVAHARVLREAQPGDITFLESDKQFAALEKCGASSAVVSRTAPADGKALIRVDDPLAAFVVIVRHLQGGCDVPVHGVDRLASVHPTAKLGAD